MAVMHAVPLCCRETQGDQDPSLCPLNLNLVSGNILHHTLTPHPSWEPSHWTCCSPLTLGALPVLVQGPETREPPAFNLRPLETHRLWERQDPPRASTVILPTVTTNRSPARCFGTCYTHPCPLTHRHSQHRLHILFTICYSPIIRSKQRYSISALRSSNLLHLLLGSSNLLLRSGCIGSGSCRVIGGSRVAASRCCRCPSPCTLPWCTAAACNVVRGHRRVRLSGGVVQHAAVLPSGPMGSRVFTVPDARRWVLKLTRLFVSLFVTMLMNATPYMHACVLQVIRVWQCVFEKQRTRCCVRARTCKLRCNHS